jgi:polyisoprenoid-binding protein YceI
LPTPALGQLVHFRLLPKESRIQTRIVDPFGQTVIGELTLREGEAQGQTKDLKSSGSVRLSIDAASYNSNLGLRDQDVQNYYLEVKDYTEIRFTSTGIDEIQEPKSPADPWQLTIKGILQLHGTKKEIRVPVRLSYRDGKITAEGNTKFALKDFNIAVPTLLFRFRSADQVEITFRFMGEQQL